MKPPRPSSRPPATLDYPREPKRIFRLAASVWTRDLGKALRLSKAIRAGTIWVNAHNAVDPDLPFGGMKQSGIGHEHGRSALDAYLETKTITIRYA